MKRSLIHTPIRIILAFVAMSLTPVSAQNANGGQQLVTINSRPSGAVVHLDGEYQFVGRTPFVVPYAVVGKYEVKASKLGYQSLRRVITFSGDASQELQLQMKLKSRARAVGRSLLAPGWGQFYSDRRTVGALYSTGTAISLVMLIKSHQDYLRMSRDYESLLARSQIGGLSYQQQREVFDTVNSAWLDVEKKSDLRDVNLYVLAGLWVVNILDSYLFFPNYGREVEIFQRFSLHSRSLQDGLSVGLNYAFN